MMIRLRTLTLLLTLALLSGCGMLHSVAQSGKLLAPESLGLIPIAPHLYAAAGHEVHPWLAQVGSHGLLHFIQRMNEGADFNSAYTPQTQQP
jgi:hypothetical protein